MVNTDELGKPIASGRTADIFAWGEDRVLKLFKTWVSPQAVEAERHKASIASGTGIRTPIVGEVLHLGERTGLIFERIAGRTMMETLLLDPSSIELLAHLLAELHINLHRHQPPNDMPAQRDLLSRKIAGCTLLTETERSVLLENIRCLCSDERLCHGDFHPGNVILAARGPVIIDWVDASRGNPIADVARTSLLFLGHIGSDGLDDRQRTPMQLFHQTYLNHYMEREPGRWSEYDEWLPIMAAARLREGIREQQDWLLQQVYRGLERG